MGEDDTPRLLIIRRGSIGPTATSLIRNLRILFAPNCATKLKEGGRQSIKDFISVKNLLGLSHLVTISQSKKLKNNNSSAATLKIVNLSDGPTLTFSIERVSLMSDIAVGSKKGIPSLKLLLPPVLVLHGFKKDELGKSIASSLQNMFPKLERDNFQRIVLCKMEQDYLIELRQYISQKIDSNISSSVRELGTKRGIKKVVSEAISLHNIFNKPVEDNEGLLLYSDHIPGFDESTKGLKIVELGPRITLKLVKIEKEAYGGAVLYHRYIQKTDEELNALKVLEPKLMKKRKREMALLESVANKFKQAKKKEGTKESKKKE